MDNKNTMENKENIPGLELLDEGILDKLSWAGKIFFAGVATYLAGVGLEKLAGKTATPPNIPFKIKGTPEQINGVASMIVASKKFQEELSKGLSVEAVINKLNLKNITKEKFFVLTGKHWPLG